MKPYSGRRLSAGCGPRSSAAAQRTQYPASGAAALFVLLAMCAVPSIGWAASANPPTSAAVVIGANSHDFCDGSCVIYDSNQAPGEPVTLDGSQSAPSPITGSPLASYAWTSMVVRLGRVRTRRLLSILPTAITQ